MKQNTQDLVSVPIRGLATSLRCAFCDVVSTVSEAAITCAGHLLYIATAAELMHLGFNSIVLVSSCLTVAFAGWTAWRRYSLCRIDGVAAYSLFAICLTKAVRILVPFRAIRSLFDPERPGCVLLAHAVMSFIAAFCFGLGGILAHESIVIRDAVMFLFFGLGFGREGWKQVMEHNDHARRRPADQMSKNALHSFGRVLAKIPPPLILVTPKLLLAIASMGSLTLITGSLALVAASTVFASTWNMIKGKKHNAVPYALMTVGAVCNMMNATYNGKIPLASSQLFAALAYINLLLKNNGRETLQSFGRAVRNPRSVVRRMVVKRRYDVRVKQGLRFKPSSS